MAAAAAVVAAAGGYYFFLIREPSEALLHPIEAALSAKHTAKVVQWVVQRRARETVATYYYIRGNRRIEHSDGEIELLSPSISADYRPDTRTVWLSRGGPDPYDSRALQSIVMPALPSPKTWEGPPYKFSKSSVPAHGSQKLYTITQQAGEQLWLYTIDESTNLPLKVEQMMRSGTGRRDSWMEVSGVEVTYPDGFAASLFDPNGLPQAVRVTDTHKPWSAQLSRTLTHVNLGGSTLALRDAQVNAKGDLFTCFAGDVPPQWAWVPPFCRLTDDTGVEYALDAKFNASFSARAEAFECKKWVPVSYPQPFRPRKFILRIIDGSATKPPLRFKTLSFDVNKPGSEHGPTYALIALPRVTDFAEKESDYRAIARHYEDLCRVILNRQQGHIGRGPEQMAMTTLDTANLEKALLYESKVVDMIGHDPSLQERQRSMDLAGAYYDLTLDLDALGRHGEAMRLRSQYHAYAELP